jgi:hypothetical protein
MYKFGRQLVEINLIIQKVYYIFLFLKVSQCKLKQKETILKLGNPLKSKSKSTKSKISWGASTSTLYQGFTLNPVISDIACFTD